MKKLDQSQQCDQAYIKEKHQTYMKAVEQVLFLVIQERKKHESLVVKAKIHKNQHLKIIRKSREQISQTRKALKSLDKKYQQYQKEVIEDFDCFQSNQQAEQELQGSERLSEDLFKKKVESITKTERENFDLQISTLLTPEPIDKDTQRKMLKEFYEKSTSNARVNIKNELPLLFAQEEKIKKEQRKRKSLEKASVEKPKSQLPSLVKKDSLKSLSSSKNKSKVEESESKHKIKAQIGSQFDQSNPQSLKRKGFSRRPSQINLAEEKK